ncbi:pre-mRNA 3' end processing protein WDR33-like [Paramacrobiotus metropolitanus]|uniref:pre-mRNA 3' end processing protein WDR33-like n=1 Tax=Paramacrobiotus metropolitanus TaxID=2943436 RepID=UPI002445812D|nr:pre-mRNA 3' end processing protein WDR33-like [Paramacrobiotus metropolitanus]XP_055341796.1 pre-mRNA 3' end processing protein WDR33-like [Paramacrobiotus metropolitanus]XP_055341797.1 pre-mRNA 3' end processing protein WDR33-like [Paramacrobiotus metropolitanus]XP_055341798.1 pre-mRNA 3' end processing protein WDR33-like [Paramacrobiotus metropolitanus]
MAAQVQQGGPSQGPRGPPRPPNPSMISPTGMLSTGPNPHFNYPHAHARPPFAGAPPQDGPSGGNEEFYSSAASGFYLPKQELDAKRLRKAIHRRTVDYFTPVVKYLQERSVYVNPTSFRDLLADPLYYSEMLSCVAYPHNASNAITTKFIRQATNKIKCPVFVVLWTPEGRRLVTGSSSGEFTLWNGLTFNFETILQAHDTAVRSMVWSRSDTWLVTGDASGYIKYWQANMNNVKSFQAHRDSIRGISFCPTDFKFATGSDDGTIRIWDFESCETLKVLRGGHGGEVKCVDWHPKKSLLVTGSRDNQQPVKLWDPRTADAIGTLYLHKGPVTDLKWNPINSNYLLSSSRDSLVKLFDLRSMRDVQTCRGHKREVMSVGWHPIYQSHFCSGGIDGSLMFWAVGTEREVGVVENAHDGSIWSMSWHPQGHILCTGSNDCSVKFWTRNRPGDTMKDKYNAKARSDVDNPLDIRGFEIEEEEEEFFDIANFDTQDITEFESNAPRPPAPTDLPPPPFPAIQPQMPPPYRPPPPGQYFPPGPFPPYQPPPMGPPPPHHFPGGGAPPPPGWNPPPPQQQGPPPVPQWNWRPPVPATTEGGAPRGGLLPPPTGVAAGPEGGGPGGMKRPWEDGGGSGQQEGGFDDGQWSRGGGRGGGRGGRGRGVWRQR